MCVSHWYYIGLEFRTLAAMTMLLPRDSSIPRSTHVLLHYTYLYMHVYVALCSVGIHSLFERERVSGGTFIYANNCVQVLKKKVCRSTSPQEPPILRQLFTEHQKAGAHNINLLRCLFGFMKIIVYEVEIWKIFFFCHTHHHYTDD